MNILVCDDEPVMADELEQWLQQYPGRTVQLTVFKYYSAQGVLAADVSFDLAILDIELGQQTGLELAQWLQQRNPQVLLLFISSHIGYVPATYRLSAFQFLQKPVAQEEFNQEIKRAVRKYSQYYDTYPVKGLNGSVDILISDILYIEVRMKKLYFYLPQTTYSIKGRMEDMEQQLQGYLFVRCHQSYLVNLRHIQRLERAVVHLSKPTQEGTTEVPISRQRQADTEHLYKKFLAGIM